VEDLTTDVANFRNMPPNRKEADRRHYLKHRDEIINRQKRYRARIKSERLTKIEEDELDKKAMEMLRKEGWR